MNAPVQLLAAVGMAASVAMPLAPATLPAQQKPGSPAPRAAAEARTSAATAGASTIREI